ncbi:MAG: beta-hexosaminidase [Oscillibacter sp.]|nr:beta-hexosaminidase [Oscillibacter sp.]
MRRPFAALLALSLVIPLAACGVKKEAEAPAAEVEEASQSGPTEEELREAAVREKIAGMTLEEKVGQLFFVQCPAADAAEKIARYHLGGVLLFTRDYKDGAENWLTREAFMAKFADFQAAADAEAPLFIGSDEEGGAVTRASRNPNLFPAKRPSPQAVFAAGGMEEIVREAGEYNRALRALGVNVNFAPVCDVSTDAGDFIYERAFGQDAEATARYVSQVVPVMNAAGIACVLKHFPGYGNNADTHTGLAIDERPYETFEKSDFLPFRAGVDAGAPFVLVSHNVVKCMDADLPASLSPEVHRVLREELGFEGVILTDDLSMGAVAEYAGDGSVAVLALRAGNDMLVTADFEAQIAQVLEAMRSGALEEAVIDAALTRVLRAKQALAERAD